MTRFEQPGRALAAPGPGRERRGRGFSPGREREERGFSPGRTAGGGGLLPRCSPGAEPLPRHPPQAHPASRTRIAGLPCPAPRVCGVGCGLGALPGASSAEVPPAGELLSQRVIRGISSYGSTKPLKIKLRTSPGILSWAFYHRSYSLGLNHRCLSLVLLSVLATWFPSTVNKHQRLCRNQLRLPRCCTQLTWLQI